MDFVIIGGVAIAAFFWAKPYLADDTNPLYAVGVFAIFFFNVVVPVLYHVIFLVTAGATPGKMAFRIKVVDEKGEEHITISRAFLREVVGKVASLLILGIGFLMPLWDAKRQALHDKIAHTVVVKAV
jgi:uncharacterized RDD family membrane protein YckC